MLNVEQIRQAFTLLHNQPDLVFLDSAASAQKPQLVLDAMQQFEQTRYANIHRGLYDLSQQATQAYEDARHVVQRFINASQPESVIFTRNTTEGVNLVAHAWARPHLQAGDAILISRLEHHANIVPWQMLAAEKGLDIIVAECTEDGQLPVSAIEAAWQPQIKMVALTAFSNALGTQPDISAIIQYAHAQGARVMLDATQAVVHGQVDAQALNADFLAFTGHKLYGPTGVGVVYIRPDLLADMQPYQGGGDMIETVQLPTGTTFAEAPAKFEAGTPNITGAVGLAAAIKWLDQFQMVDVQAHEATLRAAAVAGLADIGGVTVYGSADARAVMSFNIDGAHNSDVATLLDAQHIACRSGHHCCMPLMDHLDIPGTVRASFAIYNTMQDVERLVAAVAKAKKMLG